jgi:glyoxylase-like metal-dependent hydrolase (beta-lactamase superfamily II)
MRRTAARLLAIPLLLTGCFPSQTAPPGLPPAPEPGPVATVRTADGRIAVHAIRLGFVGVKGAHRELDAPAFIAIPAIFLGRSWTPWMPIIAFAIEHPDGTILVDTGADAAFAEKPYWACDKRTGLFYRKNLRFSVPAGDDLDTRLASIGLSADSVRQVVITHFHADHIAGLHRFVDRPVITGAGNWPKHRGSFTCRLPANFIPDSVPGAPFDTTLAGGRALTSDGRVRVIAVPGHTPGHVGVVIEDGPRRILLAGDATFDLTQSARTGITGVATNRRAARATQRTITALDTAGVLVLPAHDTTVFERMRRYR